MGSKAHAWGHDDAALLHQLHREGSGVATPMRQLGPHEERAVAVGALPAQGLESVAEGVPTLLVGEPLALNAIEGARQAGDGHVLLDEELAKVDLAPELAGGRHDIGVPHDEGQAHARHVKGLREREELHAHVEGARVVKEGAATRTVEDDV